MKHDASPVLDPPRLLGAGSAREQRLLQSARWDAAPGGARERMAGALGPVLGPVSGVASVPRADAKVTRGELLRAVFTPRAALVGLAGAGIAAYLLASQLPPLVAVPAYAPAESQLAPVSDEQSVSSGGLVQQDPVQQELALRELALREPAPRRSSSKRAVATPAVGTLLEEVRLLDTIRSALRAGELPTAERALMQYDRRFARGELRNEESVLALDLLLAKGQQEPARARARQLLEQPGMQRYATRLRAIIDGSSVSKGSVPKDSASSSSASGSSASGRAASGSDPGDAHIRARR